MQQEFVEKRGWITEEELLDFTSVARSLPGIMIANTSLIFGYHMAGVPGALAAVVGITIPSVVIIALVTLVYDAFRSNPFVLRALTGVRAAVIPIILSAALRLRKGAFQRQKRSAQGLPLLLRAQNEAEAGRGKREAAVERTLRRARAGKIVR